MTQLRQTNRNVLEPVKLLLLLLEILQLILAPPILDQVIVVLVPLVVVEHTYPPEDAGGVGAGVAIRVGYAPSAEESTFGVPHLHKIPNHPAVAWQAVFVQRRKRKAVFEADVIVGKMFEVDYFLHALLFLDNVQFQLILLGLKLLMANVLYLAGGCKVGWHEMSDGGLNIAFGLLHGYLMKDGNTFVFLKLFFLDCFFQVVNDVLDQDISLLLDTFNAVFEPRDLVVVLDVDVLAHQQYFTGFVDHVPQVILICPSNVLETEKIALVQFENAPGVSLSYLPGLLQRGQPGLFYHIHHQSHLPLGYHVHIVFVLYLESLHLGHALLPLFCLGIILLVL